MQPGDLVSIRPGCCRPSETIALVLSLGSYNTVTVLISGIGLWTLDEDVLEVINEAR